MTTPMSIVAFCGRLVGTMVDPLTWLIALGVVFLLKPNGIVKTVAIACAFAFAFGATIAALSPNPVRGSLGGTMVFTLFATAIWTLAFSLLANWRRRVSAAR